MFEVNISEAQGSQSKIESVKLLKPSKIHWAILGGGRKKDWVK